MGNCLDARGDATWVEEDYDEEDWYSSEDDHYKEKRGEEMAPIEVKVRISKKRLEELMRRANGKGSRIQELLADLATSGVPQFHQHREQHWKPVLQSIPEVAE